MQQRGRFCTGRPRPCEHAILNTLSCVSAFTHPTCWPQPTPDHMTIARFRVREETALAGFLMESLKLRAVAEMVQVGTVVLDRTKLAGLQCSEILAGAQTARCCLVGITVRRT